VYWEEFLRTYTKNTQVFDCPSRPNVKGSYISRYSMNSSLDYDSTTIPGYHEAALKAPSATYFIMDGYTYSINYINAGAALPGAVPISGDACPTSDTECNTSRQFEGNNVGFADCHVKWQTTASIYQQAYDCSNNGVFHSACYAPSAFDPARPF
jgi:prepilin-type processing-associated H-X9-DG protein